MHINAKNTLRDMKRFRRARLYKGQTTPQRLNALWKREAAEWADAVFFNGWRIPLVVRVPFIHPTKGWSAVRTEFSPPPRQPVELAA